MKTKIYSKWNQRENKRMFDFCFDNKSKLIETLQKNKNSNKKFFKPRNFFKKMAKYVQTKSQKQCKSKFQKKEILIYKRLGIFELFCDITNKNVQVKKNCVDEKDFLMLKEAPTITTFSIQSSALKFMTFKEQSLQEIQQNEPEEEHKVQKNEQMQSISFNKEDMDLSETNNVQYLSKIDLMSDNSFSFLRFDEQLNL